MRVDGDVGRLRSEADEPGWEVDPDDDWGWPSSRPWGGS